MTASRWHSAFIPSLFDRMRVEKNPPYRWATFAADLKAGLILLLIQIPFAMGIGVVSGMGIPAALYCMVIVGIVGALLGGTRSMVSGPSVAVAVIVGSILATGNISMFELSVIVIISGVMQLVLGVAGIGRFMAYLPHIVLTGFISGIGLFLIWSQAWKLVRMGMPDIIIAGICMSVILFWPRRINRFLPAQLVGVAAAWGVSAVWLPGSVLLGKLPTGLPDIVIGIPSLNFLPQAMMPALLIAVIGSAYSLMIAHSVDSLTGARHNPNRQLAATGIANMAAGVFGAVPGSGQFGAMGTVLAGGKTVVTGVIVSVLTAIFAFGFGPYLASLPLAAILSLLIWMGWGLIDRQLAKRVFRIEARYGWVFAVTMIISAAGEPLTAVVCGMIAAVIGNAIALETVERDSVLSVPLMDSTLMPDSEIGEHDPFSARTGLLALRGSFTMASSRKLAELLEGDIRDHEVVIFDLSEMTHTDDSSSHLLKILLTKSGSLGIEVIVCGVPEHLRPSFDAFDVLHDVPDERLVGTQEEAREIAASLLKLSTNSAVQGP